MPSERIGSYRLEKRLGAGGMGVVYQALDERLERRVAVKLIRREKDRGKARARFQREARAAARLDHPSIVRIFHVLEWEGCDAIVMEFVEGQSLASCLTAAPLDFQPTLVLAQDIARGLAEAHGKGIVHRDLKTENVMVDAGRRAKILDFGLAKRQDDDTLTREGGVLGTCRAMSPEQARGRELDARSDLFSFGVLLYELFAGRSPFLGGSDLETLNQICRARQAPLDEIDRVLPKGLSDLVDRLLEKDPNRRPQTADEVVRTLESFTAKPEGLDTLPGGTLSGVDTIVDDASTHRSLATAVDVAAAVESGPTEPGRVARAVAGRSWAWVGALLLALAVVLGFARWRHQEEAPLYVAVPEPRITAGSEVPGVELLASGLKMALLRNLLTFDGLVPMVAQASDTLPEKPADLARALAAREVLSTRLDCSAEICRVTLSRLRAEDSGLLWIRDFDALIDHPHSLVDAVAGHLREGYADRRRRRDAMVLDVKPADYAKLLRLQRGFEANWEEDFSLDELLAELAVLRSSSPRFLEACILEADVLAHRFRRGREAADLERAFALLDEAAGLDPSDPRPALDAFGLALSAGQLERAEEMLARLERLRPGDAGVLIRRARLLDRRGEAAAARELLERAVRRQPSWQNLFWAADIEYRLGGNAAAKRHLEELLRRFPDHYLGRSLLAQIELLSGHPRRAAELYAGLVERSPQVGEMTNLGLARMLLHDYEQAEVSLNGAAELAPDNPWVWLNLADVVQLSGRAEEAAELYARVLELAAGDKAAERWDLISLQAQALAHLGRHPEAVAAAERVYRLAPNNPQAAYEISLVYTLTGNRNAARVHARQALAQGVEPVWFFFSWFDPLREFPEIREIRPLQDTSLSSF